MAYESNKFVTFLAQSQIEYSDAIGFFKEAWADCNITVEGLASGSAIEKRWGRSAKELVDNETVWELEAKYLAQGNANYILVYSPQRVVLGGGVMHHKKLYPMIRKNVQELLNGYVQNDLILRHIDEYIVEPRLGENSGIIGALMLGELKMS